MKKTCLLRMVCAAVFFFITTSTQATLMSRLGGAAAYDDVLDITWVTDAALSGPRHWDQQVAWADGLDYLGFDDWRLASMSVAAGLPTGTTTSVVACYSATELACRDNELGYMFFQNMGGMLGDNKTGNQTVDGVLLTDVQSYYWSGTEFDSGAAWFFIFGSGGGQSSGGKLNDFHGWAVRAGDVAAVPEPGSVVLMGAGLAGLLGFGRGRRRR